MNRDWFPIVVLLLPAAACFLFAWLLAPTDGAALGSTVLGAVSLAGAGSLLLGFGDHGRSSSSLRDEKGTSHHPPRWR